MPNAVGSIGSWYARIEGGGFPKDKVFPVVHNYWIPKNRTGMFYHDQNLPLDHIKAPEFLDALKNDECAIVQVSELVNIDENGFEHFNRKGYTALYGIDPESVIHDDNGLRFTFIKRLLNLNI